MSYIKTGRPPGRPRKNPLPEAPPNHWQGVQDIAQIGNLVADYEPFPETPPIVETPPDEVPEPLSPKRRYRARRMFREHAEYLTPAQAVQVFDSRGRPRHRPTSQNRIG